MNEPATSGNPADLGFDFRAHKSGELSISRGGRVVTVLRGEAARAALVRLSTLPPPAQQQLMARLTGHYRQGNERAAARHPRNRSRTSGT